jgi:hypothetical protein
MAVKDKETLGKTAVSPADDAFAISPSDSVNFPYRPRAIHVGVAGNLVAVFASGSVITFKGCAAGSVIPIRPIRINSTGTTATDLVGLL